MARPDLQGRLNPEIPLVAPGDAQRPPLDWWPDGTNVIVGFEAKGPSKTVASVMHGKLPSKEAQEAMRAFWGERLDGLKAMLEG